MERTKPEEKERERLLRNYEEWKRGNYAGSCPVRDILDRVGDRWSVLVVLRLSAGPIRFRQLLRSVEGISQRMLTVTLRALEREGLVQREVFNTRPPSVEYSLTPLGVSLIAPLSWLAEWATEHAAEIAQARAAFDLAANLASNTGDSTGDPGDPGDQGRGSPDPPRQHCSDP